MSIDNLPAQLPREATDYFGSRLVPFIPDMVHTEHYNSLSSILECVFYCICFVLQLRLDGRKALHEYEDKDISPSVKDVREVSHKFSVQNSHTAGCHCLQWRADRKVQVY